MHKASVQCRRERGAAGAAGARPSPVSGSSLMALKMKGEKTTPAASSSGRWGESGGSGVVNEILTVRYRCVLGWRWLGDSDAWRCHELTWECGGMWLLVFGVGEAETICGMTAAGGDGSSVASATVIFCSRSRCPRGAGVWDHCCLHARCAQC